MHPILAETAARGGNLTTALSQLDIVRKDRIATVNYTAFSSANQAAVLQTIFTEGNLEMGFCGIHWFDMRRLDAQGLMPTAKQTKKLIGSNPLLNANQKGNGSIYVQ